MRQDVSTVDDATNVAPRRERKWDLLIAVALGFIALVLRLNLPADGLFFDDAWQAFGAASGSLSQLFTIGVTQPGFGLELMTWTHLVHPSTLAALTPALVAGCLGPPVAYVVLRWHGIARSVAVLLAAALAACAPHITYSGRVKPYTSEVLIVFGLAVVVTKLADRRWRASTAAAWFGLSLLVAGYSSFALVASCAAGATLVLHPNHDRKLRVVSVAAQAIGVLGVLAAMNSSHDVDFQAGFFDRYRAYIAFDANPLTFGRDIFDHFVQVTSAFPGGPAWFATVALVAAIVGLVAAARGGRQATTARFMLIAVVLAVVGAIAQRIPFGPTAPAYRLTLWLAPIVLFGLAVVLQHTRQLLLATGSRRWTVAFDATAVGVAALLVLGAARIDRSYPTGSLAATQQAMKELGPNDVLLVTRPAMFSFAFNANTPTEVQATPDRSASFIPRFADDRIHAIDFLTQAQMQQLDEAVASADRVLIVDSNFNVPVYGPYRVALDESLSRNGFELESSRDLKHAKLIVWRRR